MRASGGRSDRLAQYALLMRLDRPIGTLLLLWPTLWALWLAGAGRPDAWVLTVFLAGVLLMRSAGCVINDFADRHIDPHVARTHSRPLAAGKVSAGEALWLAAALALAAFVLVLSLNRLTAMLALAAVAVAAVYPFTKRVTQLPQLVLGVAFSWGIPMAYAAQTGTVPGIAWLLVAANVCWVLAYDTLYAMVDREDDLRIGVKSTAILFGRHDRLAVAAAHSAALLCLLTIGTAYGLNAYYFTGVGAAAGFAAYQLWLTRYRHRDACFRAFLNNAWFGATVFVALVLAHL
jgi:4-hydroxybenzoate polyprenyltransferase